MEKKETINFMQRIKSHYQEFVIDDFRIDEWHKELKKFDAEDVNAKFDEHLKNEFYGEQIPKLHFLTRRLIPSADKGKIKHYTVVCQICGQAVFDTKYEKHYSRCSSASTIVRDLKQYFNLDVDKKKLMEMNDVAFEKAYQRYLNKMYDPSVPEFRRRIIAKILYPDTDVDMNAVAKEMVTK